MRTFTSVSKLFNFSVALVAAMGVFFVGGGMSPVHAATLLVPGSHATIQAAIDAASPGDEILVADGAYSENLTIAKSLTLRGASETGVVITPVTSGYGIEVTTDNVTLENFTLQNSQHYGIKAAKCTACGYLTNLTIENVTVLNSAKSHIDLNGVQNSLVNNVTVANTPSGVGIGLQNNMNVTVSNVSSTNNAWGGVGVWSTTKPDYPTAAGTNGVVIQNLEYSGVPYGLYTQETNPVLVAPTANQFVCTVTSTNTAIRADIEEFVFYFKTKVEADAFATAVDGTTTCQPADESFPVCEDGKMYARVNTAYEGDMWYGNQVLTANTWFELGSSVSSVQPQGFVMTFDGTEVTSMFLPISGNALVTIQGSIEVYGTEIANIQPISLEDNVYNDEFTANGTGMIDFKFTITNSHDGGSFEVEQQDVACTVCTPSTEVCDGIDNDCDEMVDEGLVCDSPEVCVEEIVTTAQTTVDAVAHTSTTPLITTTTVMVGDRLEISAVGTWRAGASDEPYSRESDADGLDEYAPYGEFRFGALVGRIGAGEWFMVGTSFDEMVTESGTLQLAYWDSNHADNTGSVAVSIMNTRTVEIECPIGCGDGQINNEGEQCDDGNVINGDGCSATCQIEVPVPPVCTPSTEVCDGIDNDCDEMVDEGLECGEPELCYDDVMASEQTTVDAVAHTSTTGLVTTTSVVVGDMLDISAVGTWRAGESDEPFSRESDADGLSGYAEYEGFRYGALVGRIGAGAWFFVGTGYSAMVTSTGTLELVYWDSGYEDNTGSVAVTVTKTTSTQVACPLGCGDGMINNEGEQCDDGNNVNGDGCDNQCQIEGYCGDGQVNQPTEQCDDGNENNTDSCTNTCQIRRTSGGGSASSIVGGGNNSGPSTLPVTGPADGTGDNDMSLADAMDQIDSTTIAACNEDTYILDRLMKLSRLPYDMVYTVPAELTALIGADVLRAKTQLMQTLRDLSSTSEKNEAIRAVVCKIEMIKQARGLRHEHIGYKSGGRTVLGDYLLQYLQDIAIMEFTK